MQSRSRSAVGDCLQLVPNIGSTDDGLCQTVRFAYEAELSALSDESMWSVVSKEQLKSLYVKKVFKLNPKKYMFA